MSWQAMRVAIQQKTGSATKKAVLLVLAEAANGKSGACTLSMATIGERAELSERAVWGALQELERDGVIRRARRVDSRGHRTSDLITLSLIQPAGGAAGEPSPKSREVRLGAAAPTRTRRRPYSHLVPSLPAPGAEEPVDEPGDEPSIGRSKGRKRAATDRPDGFPDAEALAYAAQQYRDAGLGLDPANEAVRFSDYHASKGNRFADWRAAWRTWVRNGIGFARGGRPAGGAAPLIRHSEILHTAELFK